MLQNFLAWVGMLVLGTLATPILALALLIYATR
jgi:hypothetical protein